MKQHRVLDRPRALLAPALSCVAVVAFCACGDDEARPVFTESDSGSVTPPVDTPDPSPPDGGDGGDAAPPFDPSNVPVKCAIEPCVLQLAAGHNHLCARMSDATVQCWGANDYGAVGNGAPPGDGGERGPGDTSSPAVVPDLTDVRQISAAANATCATRGDGSVYCWGANDYGQLGLEAERPQSDRDMHAYAMPVALGGESAVRVDLGQRSACAVLKGGGLSCWGANQRRQLARPTTDAVLGPGRADLVGFVAVRAGSSEVSTYAITDTGALLSWGTLAGRYGSLNPDPVPAVIPSLDGVSDVAVGAAHTCAIANGSVYCWGSGAYGALGTGLPSNATLPAHAVMKTSAYAQQLSVSRRTTCVRLTDGSIQCAGEAKWGQLGIDPPTDRERVFALRPAEKFTGYAVQVVTTDTSTCALLQDGSVRCWGSNEYGQLGQGSLDTDPHPTPVTVTFR